MKTKIAVIGECMLELSAPELAHSSSPIASVLSYGGDTLNTSVYLSRLGVEVEYVTALGDDELSDWMISEWHREGVRTSLVARMADSVPGMYMIVLDPNGERSFLYWRANSPASRLFDEQETVDRLLTSLCDFPYIYLSGISLAILSEPSRDRLVSLLRQYREQGGKVIFDPNYRPKLWSDADQARACFAAVYQLTDIALPTFDDEQLLNGYHKVEDAVAAIKALGVTEMVVKTGGLGCTVYCHDVEEHVAAQSVVPVDTTAAGDSFNAAYLAHRMAGNDVVSACIEGHALAAKVIQYRGAIIPAANHHPGT